MRSKMLWVWSILVLEENREKRCQFFGQSCDTSVGGEVTSELSIGSHRAMKKLIMHALLFAVCAMGIPNVCVAQAATGSWANVSTLQSGQRIQVVKMNANKESGTVVSVSDGAIVLHEKSGEHTVQKQDIRIVKLAQNRHRLRNTLIGAAVGGGIGAGVGAVANPRCTGECFFDVPKGTTAAIGAAVGIIGGAVIGALWPSHVIIYRAGGGAS
jgi:hypothetical protein